MFPIVGPGRFKNHTNCINVILNKHAGVGGGKGGGEVGGGSWERGRGVEGRAGGGGGVEEGGQGGGGGMVLKGMN